MLLKSGVEMKRKLLFFVVSVFILVLLGLNFAKVFSPGEKKEFINPGFPKSPVDLNQDWYTMGIKNASNLTINDVIKISSYPILLRVKDGKPVEPWVIWVNPQSINLPGGKEKVIDGYSFNYKDRIYLSVDPSSFPLDFEASLKVELLPNTEGQTRVNFLTNARGKKAVGRKKGVQKWEDGTTNIYPSMLRWQEKGEGEIPYFTYTLLGDCSVEELRKIAENLEWVER